MYRIKKPLGRIEATSPAFMWKTQPFESCWSTKCKAAHITIEEHPGGMVSVWYSRTPHVIDVLEAMEAYGKHKSLDLHWAELAHTHAQKQHTSAGSINIWVPPCKGRFSGWANQYMIAIQKNDLIGRCQSGMYNDNRSFYPEILLGLLWAAADEFGEEDGLTVE